MTVLAKLAAFLVYQFTGGRRGYRPLTRGPHEGNPLAKGDSPRG